MSIDTPLVPYWRPEHLESVERADLFNADRTLSRIGSEEFSRVNELLDELAARCGRTRSPGEIAQKSLWISGV